VIAAVVLLVLATVGGIALWGAVFQGPPALPRDQGAVIREVTNVPPSVFDRVEPASRTLHRTGAAQIRRSADGRPEVLYIGGGFCPYCAAERWSLIAALGRFGTFQGLSLASSAGLPESYANTPTFSFHGSSYRSEVLSFTAVEASDREGRPLQPPTPEQKRLMDTYDRSESIPFLLIGGPYASTDSGYVPDVLQGKGWTGIASALSDPSAASTAGIVGEADVLTAAICQLTDSRPAAVCRSPAVRRATPRLSR
jgi:hypothetical protein